MAPVEVVALTGSPRIADRKIREVKYDFLKTKSVILAPGKIHLYLIMTFFSRKECNFCLRQSTFITDNDFFREKLNITF